jgi:hypothetical protein
VAGCVGKPASGRAVETEYRVVVGRVWKGTTRGELLSIRYQAHTENFSMGDRVLVFARRGATGLVGDTCTAMERSVLYNEAVRRNDWPATRQHRAVFEAEQDKFYERSVSSEARHQRSTEQLLESAVCGDLRLEFLEKEELRPASRAGSIPAPAQRDRGVTADGRVSGTEGGSGLRLTLLCLVCVAMVAACFAVGYRTRATMGATWRLLFIALAGGLVIALVAVFVLDMLASYDYFAASLLDGGPQCRQFALGALFGAGLAATGWYAHRGVERRARNARSGYD